MFVLAPYFRHRVYTVLDVIGSQRRLECTGWMQTLYARYKGPECSWSLVPTGLSGISLPKDGSLKMMPNIHQPMPGKQQQALPNSRLHIPPSTDHAPSMAHGCITTISGNQRYLPHDQRGNPESLGFESIKQVLQNQRGKGGKSKLVK